MEQVLYGRKDLDYKVVAEAIINGKSTAVLEIEIKEMGTTAYQLLQGGGIELNTFNVQEAMDGYKKALDQLIFEAYHFTLNK